MAGHNKWSKIKRKKGAEDAKRSKIFSKMIREIMVSVREGGPDPEDNPRLRTAVANAKGVNMPKENIERAIKKASEAGGEDFTETTYEGYGPGGVAFFVECTTDNLNRTVSNIRHYFDKFNGNLGKNGSVGYLFERKGLFSIAKDQLTTLSEEEVVLELIDAGAEETDTGGDVIMITTAMGDFGRMQDTLERLKITPEHASLQRIPATTTKAGVPTAKKVLQLVEALEDDDDVQDVYHNMEVTDEIAAEIE